MKNKILSISIILILLSFIFINNNVFALDYDLSDYKNHDLMSGSWFIYYSEEENIIYLVTTDSTSRQYLTCYLSNGYDWSSMGSLGNFSNMGGFYRYSFNTSTRKFEEREHIDNGCLNFGNPSGKIIASGCDLYNYLNGWSSFFQVTPVPLTVYIPEMTLSMELEKIQVQEMWKTLMKNVVISLLAFVVSYLALRKAWSFLRIQLKGS